MSDRSVDPTPDAGAVAGRRLDVEAATDGRGPLPHAGEAVGVEPARTAHAEADAVVDDEQLGSATVALPHDGDSLGLGVALDVDERLLGDAEQLALLGDGQPAPLLGPDLDVDGVALPHPGGEQLEGLEEPL